MRFFSPIFLGSTFLLVNVFLFLERTFFSVPGNAFNKKIRRKKLKKLMAMILLPLIVILLVLILPKNVSAQELSDSTSIVSEYSQYDFANCEKFSKYLNSIDIDVYDENDVKFLSSNFLSVYFDAISSHKISMIKNDILLGDFEDEQLRDFIVENFPKLLEKFDEIYGTLNVKWISDQTLDASNNGTHQVIARDAINEISAFFPGFFSTNENGVFETQCYSDYPDMYETDWINEAHFYNYSWHTNYFGNVFSPNTAKSMFFDHYYTAVETYLFNEKVALRELGTAIHYLEDLGTPVHVGDGFSTGLVAWACGLGLAPLAIIAIYGGTMVSDHVDFEEYVDGIDQTSEMNIPSSIDYDYYLTVDLNVLLDEVISNSYQYYDEAKSNDSQKFVAASNTLPYIKEVVAGILFRFAFNLSGNRQYDFDGVLVRNRACGLYLTADSTTFYNGTNVMLDSFKANASQLYRLTEYYYPNGSSGLNRSSSFNLVANTNKRFDIVNSSGSNGANLQIYDYAQVPAQYFRPLIISHSTGFYKITTEASDFIKVLSVENTTPEIGTNVYQWSYSANSYNQWYFDLLKTKNVDWKTNNLHEVYIHKGQYIYYKLVIPSSGYFVIETKSTFDTYFNLYNSSFVEIGSGSTYNDAGDENNAKIFSSYTPGTYYVRLRMNSSLAEGRVNFVAYKSNQSAASNVFINGNYTFYISSGYIRAIKFVAPSDGLYHFYTSGSLNTYLSVYDENMHFIGFNDDGIGQNASYFRNLLQGETIYLFLRYFDSTTSGSTTFHVE